MPEIQNRWGFYLCMCVCLFILIDDIWVSIWDQSVLQEKNADFEVRRPWFIIETLLKKKSSLSKPSFLHLQIDD